MEALHKAAANFGTPQLPQGKSSDAPEIFVSQIVRGGLCPMA